MKVKEGFVLREVADSFIVVPVGEASEQFKGLITLNSVGAFLWKQLETETTMDELFIKLQNEYELSEDKIETAKNDLNNFINKLRENKFINE